MALSNNLDKIHFATLYPIDKIIVDNGYFTTDVTGGSPPIPVSDTETVAHNIGYPVACNAMFSVDGSNFYPAGVRIDGAIDGGSGQPQYAELYTTSDENNVRFYMRNGFTATKTFTVKYVLEAVS